MNLNKQIGDSMTTNTLTEAFNPLMAVRDAGQTDLYAAELLRNNVEEIIGSYHHQFDHLYECVQNAVDACEKAFKVYRDSQTDGEYLPTITVVVDLKSNSLTIVDNGVGMARETVIKYFFTPYATLKTPQPVSDSHIRQRGEKGVGATFISYGSNRIHLSTNFMSTGEVTAVELRDALHWCNGATDLLPMPSVIPADPHHALATIHHGSIVQIWFSDDMNMKLLSDSGTTVDHWEAIITLHTALGFITLAHEDEFLKLLRTTLIVIDDTGKATSKQIRTGYLYPHLSTSAQVRLSSLTRDTKGNLPETQREMDIVWDMLTTEQVSEKVMARMERMTLRRKDRKSISDTLAEKHPEAYIAFVYGNEFWEERNQAIWGQEGIHQLNHGIIFATKSQKIGEQKRIDFHFRTGDFNRFFVLTHMENLKSDIGRKSLPEEIEDFSNFFANAIHDDFVNQNDCLKPSPGPFTEQQEKDLQRLMDSAYQRPRIAPNLMRFTRLPAEEQDVIAVFFDLLGLNALRGYEFYSTHIHRVYDGVARFELQDLPENRYDPKTNRLGIAADKFVGGKAESPDKCLVEFKFSSDALVRDVRAGFKRLQDIKWLVCWEIGEAHKQEGISIIDITLPPQINHRVYFGVSHLMTEGQDKVFVICLKDIIRILLEEGKLS
jgi:hypothetical protein